MFNLHGEKMNERIAFSESIKNGHNMELVQEVCGLKYYKCTHEGCDASLFITEVDEIIYANGSATYSPCFEYSTLTSKLINYSSCKFMVLRKHGDKSKIEKKLGDIKEWINRHINLTINNKNKIIELVNSYLFFEDKYRGRKSPHTVIRVRINNH